MEYFSDNVKECNNAHEDDNNDDNFIELSWKINAFFISNANKIMFPFITSNRYLRCSMEFFRKRLQYNLPVRSHLGAYIAAITLHWLQLEIKPVIKH